MGLPIHTIKDWSRTRLIVPSVVDSPGRGFRRLYGERDALCFAVVSAMRDEGVSLQGLGPTQGYLSSRSGRELQNVHSRLVWSPGDRRYGSDLSLVSSESEIESLFDEPGQLALSKVVPVGEIFQAVREKLAVIRSARKAAKRTQRGKQPALSHEKPRRDTERIALSN